MAVTKKDVEYIASLAKLKINENEIDDYTNQLNKILEYVDKLNEIDTEGVEPLEYPIENSNVFREDVERESVSTEDALKNAKNATTEFFTVPKVIKND